MGWVTVSAKIRRDLYDRLKKHNVKISEVIKTALMEEADRREREEARKSLDNARRILEKIPPEELTLAIRASRDER